MKLKSAKIQNFKSLGDIDLIFRDLTIIVGPNASGKSNCLQALSFLKDLLASDSLPKIEGNQRLLKYGNENISFLILVEDDDGKKAEYSVSLTTNRRNALIASENLRVDGIDVLKIIEGEGEVSDENGENLIKYNSDPATEGLALRGAGSYGNKPFTKKLAGYIKDWEIYDIDPERIRQYPEVIVMLKGISQLITTKESIPTLGSKAGQVQEVLNYWAENEKDKLERVSDELENILKISLIIVQEGEQIVKVLESEGKEMPLYSMSDGTLRLIAYLMLLYQSEIPSLIGIEEPERNFHPGLLKDIASIMKRLSKRTQLVLTTHSSQLLDCFSPEEISSEISIILLNKKEESGTKVCLLDKLAENREDLLDWMNDFGLGSAIYHSHLIQEILGS